MFGRSPRNSGPWNFQNSGFYPFFFFGAVGLLIHKACLHRTVTNKHINTDKRWKKKILSCCFGPSVHNRIQVQTRAWRHICLRDSWMHKQNIVFSHTVQCFWFRFNCAHSHRHKHTFWYEKLPYCLTAWITVHVRHRMQVWAAVNSKTLMRWQNIYAENSFEKDIKWHQAGR